MPRRVSNIWSSIVHAIRRLQSDTQRPDLWDLVVFALTLTIANYFWKWTVTGDEGSGIVTWCGLDVSAPFQAAAAHVTNAVFAIVSTFRDTLHQVGEYALRFDSGVGTRIVWSCTPLKQCFIWLCLILTTRTVGKKGWHKLWVIPVGWALLYGINIVRISAITLLIEFHPERFHVLHDYVFKYLFYGIMFGLWWLYAAFLVTPRKREQAADVTRSE